MVDEMEAVKPEMVKKDSTDNERKPVQKRKRVIIPSIIGVIALIVGINYYNHIMTFVSTDDAFVESHIVQISPKVSGNIVNVYVDDNQQVKKGQLLAEIDPQDYEVKYEQAAAKLLAAQEKQRSANVNVNLTSITSEAAAQQADSGVNLAKSGVEIAEKQIAQAKANLSQVGQDIDSVKAEVDLSKIEYDRYQSLYKKGVVSKQDFDKAATTYRTVRAKYNAVLERASASQAALQSAYANKESAQNQLSIAMGKLKGASTVSQQVSMSHAQLRVASAEIKQLKAAEKQAKLELSYTKIIAPQDGAITGKSIEIGSLVQAGQPLFAIVPQKRWVIANFKETQLTDMRVGQPVFVKVDAYPNKVFKGKVDSIQSSTGAKSSLFPPENAVGSFVKVVQRVPVKIVFTDKIDANYAIVPGMSVIPEVKVK